MKSTAQTTFAERTGRTLGRTYGRLVRVDRKALGWLVAHGLPAGLAAPILWVVKLGVFAVLLYAAFWLALLLVFAIAVAWSARNADWDDEDEQPEWRDGHSGWGLYDKNEWRHDPGGPDDDQ